MTVDWFVQSQVIERLEGVSNERGWSVTRDLWHHARTGAPSHQLETWLASRNLHPHWWAVGWFKNYIETIREGEPPCPLWEVLAVDAPFNKRGEVLTLPTFEPRWYPATESPRSALERLAYRFCVQAAAELWLTPLPTKQALERLAKIFALAHERSAGRASSLSQGAICDDHAELYARFMLSPEKAIKTFHRQLAKAGRNVPSHETVRKRIKALADAVGDDLEALRAWSREDFFLPS